MSTTAGPVGGSLGDRLSACRVGTGCPPAEITGVSPETPDLSFGP